MGTFLALLTGGGLAAVGGLFSGLLTNYLAAKRDERRYAHEQARDETKYAHERATARDARRQERLAETYLELLKYLSRYADWAKSVRPMWGPVPAPEPMPLDERWRIEALVTAYGSDEVRRQLGKWAECARKIEDADALIRLVEESKNPSVQLDNDAMQEHKAMPTYKEAMSRIDEVIRDQVRRELDGRA